MRQSVADVRFTPESGHSICAMSKYFLSGQREAFSAMR